VKKTLFLEAKERLSDNGWRTGKKRSTKRSTYKRITESELMV
jgi:hypothetical protein